MFSCCKMLDDEEKIIATQPHKYVFCWIVILHTYVSLRHELSKNYDNFHWTAAKKIIISTLWYSRPLTIKFPWIA
jgi:hypothetical protein